MTNIIKDNIKATESNNRILIIGPSWVGDMVMAQSLFIAIKQQQANVLIDVLAPSWSRPLLERMPEVNQAIDMPLGHGRFGLAERWRLGKSLRGTYQQSIVLPNSWKSALIPFFARIAQRIGWRGEARYGLLNDCRTLNKQQLPLMVQRFVALAHDKQDECARRLEGLSQCPTPLLIANHQHIPALLRRFHLTLDKPILVLCPGAEFGPAKQWPAKHYKTVATTMIQQGWEVWIMGSKGDRMIAKGIAAKMPKDAIKNLAGKTTLAEAIDLMSCANHVVSNDSGLMHIASALNRPVTALYGATSPQFTPPLSPKAQIASITVDCGPCFKRQCPLNHHRCMEELNPARVIEKIQQAES